MLVDKSADYMGRCHLLAYGAPELAPVARTSPRAGRCRGPLPRAAGAGRYHGRPAQADGAGRCCGQVPGAGALSDVSGAIKAGNRRVVFSYLRPGASEDRPLPPLLQHLGFSSSFRFVLPVSD